MPDAAATPPNQPAGTTPALAAAPAPAATPAPAAAPSTPAPAAPAANVAPQTAAPVRGLGDPAPAKSEAAPAAETKPGEPAKAPEAKAEAKPADWKLTAPKDSVLPAERIAQVEQYAKAEGYTAEQAQKLVERENAEVQATQNAWLKQAQSHPELKDWNTSIDNANRAMAKFMTEDERKAVLASPFKHNPLFLAMLNRIGAQLTREAAPVETSAPPAAKSQHPADRIYGNLAKR